MRFLLVTLTCLMAVSAMAQEAEEGPWSGSATLGFLSTSGNTESTSLNSGFEVNYQSGNWLHGDRREGACSYALYLWNNRHPQDRRFILCQPSREC